MDNYLVAFLDVLGFKSMLDNREFDRINSYFDVIANALYQQQRMDYLQHAGLLTPKMFNFSDSIVIYSKIHNNDRVNNLAYISFFQTVRKVLSESLAEGIPIRGAISLGEFMPKSIESSPPKSVPRTPPALYSEVVDYFGLDVVNRQLENYGSKILSNVLMPVHYGSALVSAYIQEGGIDTIGIFVDKEMCNDSSTSQFLGISMATKQIVNHEVDGNDYLMINWHQGLSQEKQQTINDLIETSCQSTVGKVNKKWLSLRAFQRSAPS